MAESVYNPNTGDIETPYEELKTSRMSDKFMTIDDTNITNLAEQNQIAPRQQRTGQQRGDQQLRGLIKVVDRNGRVVVMMGYSPGAF